MSVCIIGDEHLSIGIQKTRTAGASIICLFAIKIAGQGVKIERAIRAQMEMVIITIDPIGIVRKYGQLVISAIQPFQLGIFAEIESGQRVIAAIQSNELREKADACQIGDLFALDLDLNGGGDLGFGELSVLVVIGDQCHELSEGGIGKFCSLISMSSAADAVIVIIQNKSARMNTNEKILCFIGGLPFQKEMMDHGEIL